MPYSIHQQSFPEASAEVLAVNVVSVAVQINGRTRGLIQLAPDATQAEALTAACELRSSRGSVNVEHARRIIYVPGRILNVVF
jgi:leucyl-tRNA synthetase